MKYFSFAAGAAAAILQYLQPLDDTWIGHEKWAADNLVLAAYLGGIVGSTLFFGRRHLPTSIKILVIIIVLFIFVGGVSSSIYWSLNITSVSAYPDQLFYRDTVWRLSHICLAASATILFFCLSFFEKK